MKKYIKLLIIFLAVAVVVPQVALAAWWNPFSWNWGRLNSIFHFQRTEQKQEQTVCTQDAKQCPDGSYVGREGPKCEFKACPETKKDETKNWKTYTNTEYGFELKYPTDFKTTANKTPAGYLNLYLGYSNTPYIGDVAIQVIKNDKNETIVQYFTREKTKALQGFASKCQTCANMDVDAELYNCLASSADTIKIAGKDGLFCKSMSQRATAPSPVYVFNGEYIYEFLNYDKNNPSYEIYKGILSTFKFTK